MVRLRLLILAATVCFSTGCQTEIRTGGIGGNVSPLDPDIVYFPPSNEDMADTDTGADNANDSHPIESVASSPD